MLGEQVEGAPSPVLEREAQCRAVGLELAGQAGGAADSCFQTPWGLGENGMICTFYGTAFYFGLIFKKRTSFCSGKNCDICS